MPIEHRVLDANTRDLRPEVLDSSGRLKVMPASYYAQTTVDERAVLGLRTAAYVLPTLELVGWLKLAIGMRTAIEIGAGNGLVAESLGITATDSCMQEREDIALLMKAMGQRPVQYGRNIQRYSAEEALKKYKPKVVVACWVTHKFDERRHEAEGNMDGVVEEDVVANCESYIFIGNKHVHRNKSLWKQPHAYFEPPWLYSRAFNGSADFIAVWGKPPDVAPA
ncbi:hypothetical protein D3C71_21330 [compost metagenome]